MTDPSNLLNAAQLASEAKRKHMGIDESSQIDRPEFAAPEEVFSLLLNAGGQWQTSRPEALFGEAEPPQCVADRFPDLGAAGVGLHKARDGKAGFQFEPPLSGYFGLLDAA
jgi:hypothetical protein